MSTSTAKQLLRLRPLHNPSRLFIPSSSSSLLLRAHPITTTTLQVSPSPIPTLRSSLPRPSHTPSSFFHTTAAKMGVHEFKTMAEFDSAVKEHEIVLLDCTASWCGPCKMISPIFDDLSKLEKHEKVYFAKFDVDEVPELAAKLGIRAMPTFKAFKNGEQVEEMLGANPPALQALVEKVNPTENKESGAA